MALNRKLRVAIECRIDDPRSGIGSAVLSLAHALSESTTQDQEYTFIVHADTKDWLEPHIFGPCRLVGIERPQPSRLKRVLKGIAPLRRVWRRLKSNTPPLPVSDGYVESERFDLVHFVTQGAYSTSRPNIYQPWDLQHLHYPEFFSKADFALREQLYRAFCAQAVYVCVQTQWSKHDVTQHYSISPDKVVVIRWGSVFDAYTGPSAEARQATRQKYNLSDQFFFYPAVTWPHKNHEVILRALHRLKRDHGRKVAVYFTGASTEFRKKLDETARELNIFEQVHYLGFVTPEELQSIFSAATAMVFPSKFEGFGLPILEAFHAQLPVLSSTASVLPEVANDGALYFDPDSPAELAELMIQMLDDPGLRKTLIDQGAAQLSRFSINDTAVSFQRLYAQMTENAAGGNAVQLDRALAAQSMERD